MCRFVFYQGPELSLAALLTEPEHSLIHQSHHARERLEPLNGDGFGVSWYLPHIRPEPVVFKEISPAWNSVNLISLAPVSVSGCILAHVRAASPGLGVSQSNCHPFVWRRFSFMHNGAIANFPGVRRRLLAGLSDQMYSMVRGSTDSEVVFAMLVDRLVDDSLETMAGALAAVVAEVEDVVEASGSEQPSTLNLCLSDGEQAVIARYATPGQSESQSLYLNQGRRYRCQDGVCLMEEIESANTAVLVSSEPLSGDPGWEKVPSNQLLCIGRENSIERHAIEVRRSL